jgi:hypothetical protein
MNEVDTSNYIAITTKHPLIFNYQSSFFSQESEPTLSDIAPSLKQELLLFDKVGIAGLEQFMQDTDIPIEQINNELNWLIDQELVFDAHLDIPKKGTKKASSFNDFLNSLGMDIDIWNEVENYHEQNNIAIKPLREFHSKVVTDFINVDMEMKFNIQQYNRSRWDGNQEEATNYLSEYTRLVLKKADLQKELKNRYRSGRKKI